MCAKVIRLSDTAAQAIERLNEKGFEAYAVGGCVRDSMMGNLPQDWDITTNALPEEMQAVFADFRTLPTGIQHGTLTVLIDGQPLEITTYRVDGSYSDNRHPDAVTFTRSLAEDLKRRDFTVNAMAYHPKTGVVDNHSGLADLEQKRICCVGEPEVRFTEDALRILRALRFASVLGFSIEKKTAEAIHRLHPLLRRVSPERIAAEWTKLLCGSHVKEILNEYPDVVGTVFPELSPCVGLQQENPYHHLDVYAHTAETVAAIPAEPVLRLTMLFHDCGKPGCYTRDAEGIDHFRGHAPISALLAEQALTRLRYDNQTVKRVKELVLHHDDTLTPTDKCLKRLLNRFGDVDAFSLIAVQRADVMGQHPDKRDRLRELDGMSLRLQELLAEHCCYSLKDLAVNGKDLQEIGYSAGRELGDALFTLLEEVMDGDLPNERCSLLRRAQEIK